MSQISLEPFKGSYLFAEMTSAELELLGRLFEEMFLEEGKTVFSENMPGESLFLIKEGTIRVSKMISEADEKTLVILGPEDVFGEMAIADGAPRSVTARVIESARLLKMSKGAFETLCRNQPGLGLKLMRNVVRVFSQRVRENQQDYREMLLFAANRPTEN